MFEIYFGTAFLAGILSFFSPCIVPILPLYFSIFADDAKLHSPKERKKQVIIKTALFVAGISVCFLMLGFGAGFVGSYIYSQSFLFFLGIIVIALGLHQTGIINIKWLMYEKKVNFNLKGNGYLNIFILGFSFSFGWTPCIGPVLGAILGLSASGSNPLYGIGLTAIYSLGFLIPFLILAIFSEFLLSKLKFVYKHFDKIKFISGLIIIIMGMLLMSDNVNFIMRYIS